MFSLEYEIFMEDYLDANTIWFRKSWVKWIILRGFPAFMTLFCTTSAIFSDHVLEGESELDKLFFRFVLGAGFFSAIAFCVLMRPSVLAKSIKERTNKSIEQDQSRIGRRQALVDEQSIVIGREGEFGKIHVLWKNICGV